MSIDPNPTSVRYYTHTMPGAPSLNGVNPASLLGVLHACLVTGFGGQALSSVSVSGGVATAQISQGHSLPTYCVQEVSGPYAPSALVGPKRCRTTSPTTFTFPAPGVADGQVAAALSTYTPPLGWERLYTSSTAAVYRRPHLDATPALLRVAHGPGQYSFVQMYMSMSGIDSGSPDDLCPAPSGTTTNGYYWPISSVTTDNPRGWILVGDHRGLVFLVDHQGNPNYRAINIFGDLEASLVGSPTACVLSGAASSSIPGLSGLTYGTILTPRNAVGAKGAIALTKQTHGVLSAPFNAPLAMAYPSPLGGHALLSPVDLWEAATARHGGLRGVYSPLHYYTAVPDGEQIELPALPGRIIEMRRAYSGALVAIDLTGPW